METSTHSTTSTQSTGATGQVQDKAQEVAGQAQEKAREAADQARGQLRSQVDQRSTQAGDQVNSTASDVRSVADQLRQQGKHQPAKLADQAADRAERLGGYLKDSDADTILGDIEDFARRQPWTVMLGGLALGFAASRFLKASSENRSAGRDYSGRYASTSRPRAALPPATSVPPATSPGRPVSPAAPTRSRRRPRRAPTRSRRRPRRAPAPARRHGRRERRRRDDPGQEHLVSVPPGAGNDLRDEGIGELLKQLSQETTTLVRQELELAKAEMTVKAKEGGKGAGLLGGAGVAGLLTLGHADRHPDRPARPRDGVLGRRADRRPDLGRRRRRARPPGPQQAAGGHASCPRTDTAEREGGRPWAKTRKRSAAR